MIEDIGKVMKIAREKAHVEAMSSLCSIVGLVVGGLMLFLFESD